MSAFTFVGSTSKSEWVLQTGQNFTYNHGSGCYRVVGIDVRGEHGASDTRYFALLGVDPASGLNWRYAHDTLDGLAVAMNKAGGWDPKT